MPDADTWNAVVEGASVTLPQFEPPSVEIWYCTLVATGDGLSSVTSMFVPPAAAVDMDLGIDGVMRMTVAQVSYALYDAR